MSGYVDVLAVMRGMADPANDFHAEAIAAVADLIEAAEYGREWIVEAGDRKGLPNGGTLRLIDAALARVRGAA